MKRIIIATALAAAIALPGAVGAQTRDDIMEHVIWPCVDHEVQELDLEECHPEPAMSPASGQLRPDAAKRSKTDATERRAIRSASRSRGRCAPPRNGTQEPSSPFSSAAFPVPSQPPSDESRNPTGRTAL